MLRGCTTRPSCLSAISSSTGARIVICQPTFALRCIPQHGCRARLSTIVVRTVVVHNSSVCRAFRGHNRDNPALHKHHKLARSLLSAGFAKELKPDSEERRRLEMLVHSPPTARLREEVCTDVRCGDGGAAFVT